MTILNTIVSNFIPFLMMAAGFAFVIFIHELGHFLAAKAVNIKVTQFAIGFGTAICSWRKGIGLRPGSTEKEYASRIEADATAVTRMGETEYRLNWVPLGGYVKMVGQEDLKPDAVSSDPRSYTSAPAWARAIVLSAGVVMNIISGLLFFFIAFTAGVAMPPAVIGYVLPDSPAAKAYAVGRENDDSTRGLRAGDTIELVNGETITDFTELAVRTALTSRGEPITVTVRRDNQPAPLEFAIVPEVNPATKLLSLGVMSAVSIKLPTDVELPDSLVKAGVEPGMTLTAVDGKPVTRFDQVQAIVSAAQGQPVDVTFTAISESGTAGKSATAKVVAVPQLSRTVDEVDNLFGLVPATIVQDTVPNSPAQIAGVKPGDLIVRIDSRHWPRIDTVPTLIKKAGNRPIDLVLLRNDSPTSVAVKPTPEGMIGIRQWFALDTNIVAEVLHDSPLEPLSLNDGSRISAINGEKINGFADIQRVLKAAVPADFKKVEVNKALTGDALKEQLKAAQAPAMTVTIETQRNIVGYPTVTSKVTFSAAQTTAIVDGGWSIHPSVMRCFDMLTVPLAANDPAGAMTLGMLKTKQFMLQTYVTIARLFQGTIKMDHLRGPVGIATEGTRIASKGWTYLFFFLGLISINLAVMNFLPLPVLDGGQLVLLMIEKIKGSPVDIRAQEYATYLALAALACLVVVTLVLDVKRLFE